MKDRNIMEVQTGYNGNKLNVMKGTVELQPDAADVMRDNNGLEKQISSESIDSNYGKRKRQDCDHDNAINIKNQRKSETYQSGTAKRKKHGDNDDVGKKRQRVSEGYTSGIGKKKAQGCNNEDNAIKDRRKIEKQRKSRSTTQSREGRLSDTERTSRPENYEINEPANTSQHKTASAGPGDRNDDNDNHDARHTQSREKSILHAEGTCRPGSSRANQSDYDRVSRPKSSKINDPASTSEHEAAVAGPSYARNSQHLARGGKPFQHGFDYQLKLLMMYAVRGAKLGNVRFRLATEMSKAGKFDDLVIRYETKHQIYYQFLQAKHRQLLSKKNKITIRDLTSQKKKKKENDFSLQKYFISYMNDMKGDTFQDGIIKDLIICTNTDFDFEVNETKKKNKMTENKRRWKGYLKEKERDEYLDFNGKIYQFKKHKGLITELMKIFAKSPQENKISSTCLERDIEEFLDKLVFVVRQPRSDLEKQIRETLGDPLTAINDITYSDFFEFMTGWMQHRTNEGKAHFLTENDIEEFMEKARQKISYILLTSPTTVNINKLKDLHFAFSISCLEKMETNSLISVFYTEYSQMTTAKLFQILEMEGISIDKCIYSNLADLLKLKDVSINGFKSEYVSSLVIEITSDISDNTKALLRNYFEIVRCNLSKRIFLITVSESVKEYLQNLCGELSLDTEEKLTVIDDSNNSLADLNSETQQKFLEEGKVIFQGREMSIGSLLESTMYNLVTGSILFKLLQKEEIRIGNEVVDSKYSEMKDYYINRKFSQLELKDKFKKRSVSLKVEKLEEKKFVVTYSGNQTRAIKTALDNGCNILLVSTKWTVFEAACNKFLKKRVCWFEYKEGKFILRKDGAMGMTADITDEEEGRTVIRGEFISTKQQTPILGTIDKTKLRKLQIQVTTFDQLKDNKDIILIASQREVFEALRKIYKNHNIHWFMQESDKYLWQNSHGKTEKLQEFTNVGWEAEIAGTKRVKVIKNQFIIKKKKKTTILDKKKLGKLQIHVTDEETTFQLKDNKDIMLIASQCEVFETLHKTYKNNNIHWFRQNGDKFMWQDSHGKIEKLRECVFVDTENENLREPKSLDQFSNKVTFITADSGMGKSTVLTHLALETKKHDPSIWILRLNLLDHTKYLDDLKESQRDICNMDEVLKFLYWCSEFHFTQKSQATEDERRNEIMKKKEHLLSHLQIKDNKIHFSNSEKYLEGVDVFQIELFNTFYNNNKIFVVIDGFDEISPNYKEQVSNLLNVLKDCYDGRIWVSTRPYDCILEEMENKLCSFSCTLQPLSRDEQKEFLKKFWGKKSKNGSNTIRLEEFAEKVVKEFNDSINDDKSKFMSNPLLASMVATNFEKFIDSNPRDLSEIFKQKESNLVTLYKDFVDSKHRILLREKKKGSIPTDPDTLEGEKQRVEIFFSDYKKLSAFALFDKKMIHEKTEMDYISELLERIRKGTVRTGIIEHTDGKKPQFVHQSFTEYFAAEFICDALKENLSKLCTFLFNDLLKKNYPGVRIFFDCKLQIDKDLAALSSMQSHKRKILNTLIQKAQICGKSNKNHKRISESPLCVAAKEGLMNIVQFLLQSGQGNVEKLVKIVNSSGSEGSPLCVAVKERHNSVIVKILEHVKGKIVDVINHQDCKKQLPLHLAISEGHEGIVSDILVQVKKDDLQKVFGHKSDRGKTALHVAASNADFNSGVLTRFVGALNMKELLAIKDSDNQVPEYYARENNNDRFLALTNEYNTESSITENCENAQI